MNASTTAGSDGLFSYPVLRLLVGLILTTVGSSAMYVVAVVLPPMQAEFQIDRSDASLPYASFMIGFGLGGIVMGRMADRFGAMVPVMIGAFGLASGYWLAAQADSLLTFSIINGVLLGLLGSSATFSPLISDVALWFDKRRGIAVAICASGNYLAGVVWPPIVQQWVESGGWRSAYENLALVVLLISAPLALVLRRRAPALLAAIRPMDDAPAVGQAAVQGFGSPAQVSSLGGLRPLGLSPRALQNLLCIAGIGCCVAMSMPQVHIVAYCTDLGFGAARGAQMLSLMLGFGIVSRLVSGLICDRIGGLRTLLIGSALQALALVLFLPFDSLVSLYVISAIFGLFQGGLVPSYAIIVREHFAPNEVGVRTGIVLTSTIIGMALGGWMSGKVFDLTGSYEAAFINGIAWNLVNFAIVAFLLTRSRRIDAGKRLPSGGALGAAR